LKTKTEKSRPEPAQPGEASAGEGVLAGRISLYTITGSIKISESNKWVTNLLLEVARNITLVTIMPGMYHFFER